MSAAGLMVGFLVWFLPGLVALGFALLALHRDYAIAAVAVAGGIASAILNLILTPLAGLWGAATAYVLTSGGLFAARYVLSRPAFAPKPKEDMSRPLRATKPLGSGRGKAAATTVEN